MPAITTSAERAAAAPPSIGQGEGRREARLRPEHAHRYPGVPPGQWEPAATLADRVLASRLLRGRDLLLPARSLLDTHFDFRGGDARRGGAESPGPRRE